MLETNRLIMRPHLLTDAQDMMILNQDPDVIRYTGDVGFKTLEDSHKVISERLIPQFNLHKMGRFHTSLKDGTFIGWCGLRFFPEQDEVDLGYRFMKKFWGQGFATESSKRCLEYGFQELKLKRIIAKAMPENIPSIKVIQKLGMTFKGYVKDPLEPHPFIVYELLAKDFHP